MQSGRTKSSEQHVRHGLAAVVALTLAIAAAWQAGFTRLAAHSAMNAAVSSVNTSARQTTSRSDAAAARLELKNSASPLHTMRVALPVNQPGTTIDLVVWSKSGLIALPPPTC